MKARIFFFLLSIALSQNLAAQGQFNIGLNGNVVCQGSPFVVVSDMELINSGGNFEAGNSFTNITSAGAPGSNKIDGFEVINFSDLIVSHPSNFVQLFNDIEIDGSILMGGGKINLRASAIHLMNPASSIAGETETSRITTTIPGGYISWNHPLLGIATSNPGNLGAEITTAALPGLTEVRRGHYPSWLPTGWSIARWYDFDPTNNAGLNATLRLHYLDAEVIGIPEEKLGVWKSTDFGSTWTLAGSSASNPVDNWIEVTGENVLARYTLGLMEVPPVAPLVDLSEDRVAEVSEMILFPNPVEKIANVFIQSAVKGLFTLDWYNLDGKLMLQTKVQLEVGPNTLQKDVSGLPAGTYLVRYRDIDMPAIKMIKI